MGGLSRQTERKGKGLEVVCTLSTLWMAKRPPRQEQIGGRKLVSDKTKGQMEEKTVGQTELGRAVRTLVYIRREMKTTGRF